MAAVRGSCTMTTEASVGIPTAAEGLSEHTWQHPDANAKTLIVFGGNPQMNVGVVRMLSPWYNVYGVLSEEEGLSKAKDGSIAKLDGIVIGTKYSEEQRERIRAALPGIPTCEPGIHFAGGHGDASTGDRIIADLAEKLK